MKKAVAVLCLALFFMGCRKEKPVVQTDNLTPNQKEIIKWYRKVNYYANVNPDSIQRYALTMEKAAAHEPDDYKAMALLVNGYRYASTASYELALKNYEQALALLRNSKADTLVARTYGAIGNYYKNTGEYPRAFGCFYKSLHIFEKYSLKAGIAQQNCNIGQVYFQKGDIETAALYLKTAMKILEKDKSNMVYLTAAHHLANIYGMKGEYAKAMKIDEEGIRISDRGRLNLIKVSFLDNKANCFMALKALDSAQFYFNECLKLDILGRNKKQIADSYSNLGQLAAQKHEFAKAEALLHKSIDELRKIRHKHNLAKSYDILANVYEKQGKYKEALQTHRIFHEVYQGMIDEKKEASLAEYKIVYDTQKKEKQLAENKVLLLQQEAQSKRKNEAIAILSILAVFILVVALLIYRQQKLRSNQREQEFKLKAAISVIETQNKLQQQRLSISRDLHDNIGAQLTFIISSVDTVKYGFDLKNSKLSGKLDTISDFTKSTIIELRDTIWAMNNNAITFEDLRARILNFIEKAKIVREDIQFEFSIDAAQDEIVLTSIEGINIYRSIQEALNNTIKYAEASRICITVSQKEDRIEILVRDNGKGFDPEKTEKGNGLHNMQKRIEDIGGIFAITTVSGSGTTISISIKKGPDGIINEK